jgi:hypothetical protein
MEMDIGWGIYLEERLPGAVRRQFLEAEANSNMESTNRTQMPVFRLDLTTQEDTHSKQLGKEKLAERSNLQTL